MTGEIFDEAFVCGRFQPPHNEHVDYLLRAKARCRFLWIGIVRPDIQKMVPSEAAVHRQEFYSNPLTYFERVGIICRALTDVGVNRAEFACTPFPLDEPILLPDFVSRDVPCLTSHCDPWNEAKKQLLEQAGYRVEVLFARPPEARLQGSTIREAIVRGDRSWEAVVPDATKEAVYRLNLRDRLLAKGLRP
jgi:nicotinamide mononucleotide adenylyltransferase